MAQRFVVNGVFPFAQMKVGDWFQLPTKKTDGARLKAFNYASQRNYTDETGDAWKFVFRRDKEHPGFHRCIRVYRPPTPARMKRALADPNYRE